MTSGNFYVGTWFVQSFPIPIQQDWLLPLDGDHQHLKDTQNVEELRVNPEDMDELPQDIQAGADEWITFSSPDGEFYMQGFPSSEFYSTTAPGIGGFYLVGIGI